MSTATAERRVRQGQAFSACTGQLVTTSELQHINILFQNPPDSGKNLLIYRVVTFTTTFGYFDVQLSPTENVPKDVILPVNALLGSPPGVGHLLAAMSEKPMSGGTPAPLILTSMANERVVVELDPLILRPGLSIGVSAHYAAADITSILTVYWYEE